VRTQRIQYFFVADAYSSQVALQKLVPRAVAVQTAVTTAGCQLLNDLHTCLCLPIQLRVLWEGMFFSKYVSCRDTDFLTWVDPSQCGEPRPHDTEECPPCICDNGRDIACFCNGMEFGWDHWTNTSICACDHAYTGARCEQSTCPPDWTKEQCSCCPSGVVDALGSCCYGGMHKPVLDSLGMCCDAGYVDNCGVCGGSGDGLDNRGFCCKVCVCSKCCELPS
jgi:hypothetical protein